ncbi:hypothetical protein [Nitrosomonas sp. Nm33]|uniref:hypothetical protein n=1 Tax=Nitrosomonas sp. Nm33 TaxID=133724 RepID=UPI0008943688|nr:hypothetical protein [Nitrosomonas sp. Nm33]SDY30742.1 hypothetical protein SAMN05421755_101540 [Nitrosomonas sp. Nm33]
MKTKISLTTLLMVSFLSACAQMNPVSSMQSNEIGNGNLNAIDRSNHDALAQHYENTAKELQVKLQEQQKLLKEYEDHNYYYGRKGQNLNSQTSAKVRHLEKLIKENLDEAAIHRKMARDQEKRNYTDVDKRDFRFTKEDKVY